jgi:hypothetical protein
VSNGNLIWNDQDKDKFFICNYSSPGILQSEIEENLIDIFTLSSAFTQTFSKQDECILCSFEGNFIKYNFKEKKIKSEKNVKNYLSKEMKLSFGNYLANPPFINKCLFNKANEEVYLGLMNGVIICLKNNFKTKFVKSLHNGAIRDLKEFNQKGLNNEIITTLGKDKIINAFNSEGEIKLSVDLTNFVTEDPFMIDSDSSGDLYYLDENSKNLKIIKLKR